LAFIAFDNTNIVCDFFDTDEFRFLEKNLIFLDWFFRFLGKHQTDQCFKSNLPLLFIYKRADS